MKEGKLEQLRTVFKESISKSMSDLQYLNMVNGELDIENYSRRTANQLVYEVKIRMPNK